MTAAEILGGGGGQPTGTTAALDVLVVDDDLDARRALERCIREALGHRTRGTEASCGRTSSRHGT